MPENVVLKDARTSLHRVPTDIEDVSCVDSVDVMIAVVSSVNNGVYTTRV
jgi:hypothetical protein